MPLRLQFLAPRNTAPIRFNPNGIPGIFFYWCLLVAVLGQIVCEAFLSDWHRELSCLCTSVFGVRSGGVVETSS
jgi:hypothetical protein